MQTGSRTFHVRMTPEIKGCVERKFEALEVYLRKEILELKDLINKRKESYARRIEILEADRMKIKQKMGSRWKYNLHPKGIYRKEYEQYRDRLNTIEANFAPVEERNVHTTELNLDLKLEPQLSISGQSENILQIAERNSHATELKLDLKTEPQLSISEQNENILQIAEGKIHPAELSIPPNTVQQLSTPEQSENPQQRFLYSEEQKDTLLDNYRKKYFLLIDTKVEANLDEISKQLTQCLNKLQLLCPPEALKPIGMSVSPLTSMALVLGNEMTTMAGLSFTERLQYLVQLDQKNENVNNGPSVINLENKRTNPVEFSAWVGNGNHGVLQAQQQTVPSQTQSTVANRELSLH